MGKPEVKPIEKMYPEWSKLCDNNVSILATYISNLKFDWVNFLKCVWKGFCYVKFWRYVSTTQSVYFKHLRKIYYL